MHNEDQYLVRFNIRNTPEEGLEYGLVQRLMGWRTRTLLPTNSLLLESIQVNTNLTKLQLGKKDENW